ncbi:Serine/threonine-protein kinase SRPK [Madurella fahalii]|uniref:non-specific serine/threonine protein kinase n=1 Tax=Madurella fahalii TaxID=1157608 RepID=A0ABQ0GFL9_9PEZI
MPRAIPNAPPAFCPCPGLKFYRTQRSSYPTPSHWVYHVFITKWAESLIRRTPLVPLQFPSTRFQVIPSSQPLEEERLDEFRTSHYYPVQIGDVYTSKYQVLGKLGYGTTSTVWLARNLVDHGHVALKIYTQEGGDRDEFQAYDALSKANPSHPEAHVGQLERLAPSQPNPSLTVELLKPGLKYLFLALDCLHSECKLVDTDINADNILQEIVDDNLYKVFTKEELESPSPRKVVDAHPIYMSRRFGLPRDFGGVVLSDFGAAVRRDVRRNHDAQPNVYRSPEVMLKTEWSYPVDIWNVGVMTWDIFEDKHMFYGNDPDGSGYKTRAHLAELIGMLGPPPLDLIKRGKRSPEFFTPDGHWNAGIPIPEGMSLEASEENLDGKEKAEFLRFIRSMLQWRPEDRKTARELLEDRWLNS